MSKRIIKTKKRSISKRKKKFINNLGADKQIAIISDRLTAWGGAELTIKVLSDMYPEAPIYTSVYDKKITDQYLPGRTIIPSIIQYLPFEKHLRNEYSILYWLAFKLFNLRKFDAVISVSSAYAKFVSTPGKTKHVCFCLTPPRFLWIEGSRSTVHSKRITFKIYNWLFKRPLHWFLRKLDVRSIEKADVVTANSSEVAGRIKRVYGIDAEIYYPPLDLSDFELNTESKTRGKWMMYLGRVETYKGVEIAIRACSELKVPLQVAGAGNDLERMKELVKELNAKGYVKFLGFVSEEQKKKMYFNCKALIYPVRDEDFGLVPIEANATGCPVIAYRGGGVLETLSEDNPRTAVLFDEYSVESLKKAIVEFDNYEFNPDNCRKQANQFAKEIFEYKVKNLINNVLSDK